MGMLDKHRRATVSENDLVGLLDLNAKGFTPGLPEHGILRCLAVLAKTIYQVS